MQKVRFFKQKVLLNSKKCWVKAKSAGLNTQSVIGLRGGDKKCDESA
jgi:hypothetical protein